MSSGNIDVKLPITGNGWVQLKIEINSVEKLADRDRAFILSVIEKLAAFAPVALADPAHPAAPALEVPEALRGVMVGSAYRA